MFTSARLLGVSSGFSSDTDPFWSDVVFMSNMGGANGSTTFTDVRGHAITPQGNAVISNEQPIFGTNTLKLTGALGFLQVAGVSDFAFGTGDLTIDCWVYLTAYSGGVAGGGMFATINSAKAGYVFHTGQNISACRLTSNASGAWADNLTVSANNGVALSSWQLMTYERSGSTQRIYRNGQIVATNANAAAYNFTGSNGYIGRFADGTSSLYITGYVGPTRVTKRARYNNPFTPPSGLFPNH